MTALSARLPALAASLLLFVAAPLLRAPAAFAAAPAPVQGAHAMVVTPAAQATRAGIAMIEAGGNAMDAAIAASFVLGVVQPMSNGIGGGDFILVRMADGRAAAIDARETAPAAATQDMYTKPGVPEHASILGGLAVGTPGSVAGRALALERFGKLPLSRVMAPAIHIAEQGYAIGAYQAKAIDYVRDHVPLDRFQETERIQLPAKPKAGYRLVQPDLAATLRDIAARGPRAFYTGPRAQAIASAVQAAGGVLTAADLADYTPVVREPLRGRFKGYTVLGFPPPSSGGVTMLEILNILEGFDLAPLGADSSASIHRIAEAMKLAFADRAVFLGDPDFSELPVKHLLDKAYAAKLRSRIDPAWWKRAPWHWLCHECAIQVKGPGFVPEDHGTAHLSVVDGEGNAVAITSTINGPFGSLITVPGQGIVLNNEMDDFVTQPGRPNLYGLMGEAGANLVAPRKRPLSSMAPTIVTRGGKVRFVAGSNGGPVIITSTLLALLNHLVYGMDVEEAVSAPRFHHQWSPDVLRVEDAIPEDVVEALRRRGHHVEVVHEITSGVEAVAVDPVTGVRSGGVDPRREGMAEGL